MRDDQFNPQQPPGGEGSSLGPSWKDNPLSDPNDAPKLPRIKGALELRDATLLTKFRSYREDNLYKPYSEFNEAHKAELLIFLSALRKSAYILNLKYGENEPAIDVVEEEAGVMIEGESVKFIVPLFLRSDNDQPQIIAEDDEVIDLRSSACCIVIGSSAEEDFEFIPQLSEEACEEITDPEQAPNSIWMPPLKSAVNELIEDLGNAEIINELIQDELDAESIIDDEELYSFEPNAKVHVSIDDHLYVFSLGLDEYGMPLVSLFDEG